MAGLGLIIGALLILTISIFSLLFIQNGKLAKNKYVSIATLALVSIITFISATSLPSNFIWDIGVSIILGVIGIISSIAIFKKEDISIYRIVFILSIIGNLIIAFVI